MKTIYYLIPVLVILLVVLLLLIPNPPDKPNMDLSYAEVTLDDPLCTNDLCLLEYTIVSNGFILKKVKLGDSVSMDLREAEITRAKDAITKISNLQKTNTILQPEVAQYHIYTVLNSLKTSYISPDDETSIQIMQMAQDLYDSSQISNDFLIQFVYWRQGENIKDYHIFADGTVVYSEFTPDGELSISRLFELDESTTRNIQSKKLVFDTQPSSCGRDGFIYGYVSVINNNIDNMVYTCGAGNSQVDILFNYLLENVR